MFEIILILGYRTGPALYLKIQSSKMRKWGQLVIEIRKTISILVDRDNSLRSLNRSNLDANGHKSQPTEHFPREHLMLS